jgi:hypothetical protein
MGKWGEVLKIFVMGDPYQGLHAVEVANWSGKVFVGQRKHAALAHEREELEKTGIYFLLTTDQDDQGKYRVYIGETDSFSTRIKQHHQHKSWWDKFVVFVSGDDNITKAHAKYLEQRLHQIASSLTDYVELENTTSPGGAKLPESEVSFSEIFLEKIFFVLGALGYDYLIPESSQTGEVTELTKTQESQNPFLRKQSYSWLNGQEFEMHVSSNGSEYGNSLKALMKVVDGKILLRQGSFITTDPAPSFESKAQGYFSKWKKVVSTLTRPSDKKGYALLKEDMTFDSPSAAAAIAAGMSINGLIVWRRNGDRKTFKECVNEELSKQTKAA